MELNGEKMPLEWMGARLQANDRVTFLAPGGGGLGPARERSAESVAADVDSGLVSADIARDIYGYQGNHAVAIDANA
jgi:N-methylhydantoinase B